MAAISVSARHLERRGTRLETHNGELGNGCALAPGASSQRG